MPQSTSHTRRSAAAVALVLLLAGLLLAACGGSSAKTGSSATASASASTGGATHGGTPSRNVPGGAPAGRFSALRECLRKNGITPPARPPGQRARRGGRGFPGLGGGQLPKGVTRARYEAALRKCGSGAPRRATSSPAFKSALAKFAACMRGNGVKLPEPNTSGKGPIFDTKGIDTTGAQFKTAETKCSATLRSTFSRGPRRAAPPG